MDYLRINTLGQLPPHVKVPGYDVSKVTVGVAHFGATSAFGAANTIPFIDAAMSEQAKRGQTPDLGVVAVKTTSGPLPEHLSARQNSQDGLYTVTGLNGRDEVRVIGAVREIVNYGVDPAAVIDRLADPKIKIFTITGTQAGYVTDKTGRNLDVNNESVKKDLENPWRPVTLPGIIVAVLARRQENGVEPPMIISCDNLPSNGKILGNVLNQFAEATGIVKPEYMQRVQTPDTMVDRITPKQDHEANGVRLQRHGVIDTGAIVTEGKFTRWTIEQPKETDIRLGALAAGGVQIVRDLAPYEDMKIRGLNGSHLALGLVGTLSGKTHVHEAMADPVIRPFIGKLLDQTAATVHLPAKDTSALRPEVMGRFDNAEMPDTLSRLLKETSSKVSARLVNYEAIKEGKGYEASAFAVAAWVRFIRGDDRFGNPADITDKRASEMGNAIMSADFRMSKFLTSQAGAAVFDVQRLGVDGEGQRVAKPFVDMVERFYTDISGNGVKKALERAFGRDEALVARQEAATRQMQGGEPDRPAARRQMGGTDPNPGQQG